MAITSSFSNLPNHPFRIKQYVLLCKSVHNQRIERLWRDVFDGVLYIYYHLFYHLENSHIIDLTNETHFFAVHYVYVPKINNHLNVWKAGYVRHHIRTAGNRTPMQLYVLGLLRMHGNGLTKIDYLENVLDVSTIFFSNFKILTYECLIK